MSNSNGFPSRRSLLKNIALMSLAGPVVRSLAAPVAGAPIRRLVTFFHPVGMSWPAFSLRGASDTQFTLGRSLAPLAPVKDRVMVIDSPDRSKSATENGRVGLSNNHFQGSASMFTATAVTNPDDTTNYGPPKGVSIDIHCANKLHRVGQRALQFGVNSKNYFPVLEGISHQGNGNRLIGVTSPLKIFDDLFKDLIAAGGNNADAAKQAAALRARRKSMLDASIADFGTLGRMVGTNARQKLNADLQAFRELEMTMLTEVPPAGPMDIGVNRNDLMFDSNDDAQHLNIGKRHSDIMVAAMRADLSRFASIQYGSAQTGLSIKFMPASFGAYGRSYHDGVTHADSPGSLSEKQGYQADLVKVWADQLMYLVDKMKASVEIDGSGQNIFDNSAILWTTEIDEIVHGANRTPYVTVGNMGGALAGGKHIKTGQTDADLLLSMAVAAGASTAQEKFGYAPICSGVIAGMLK
jgi:Protein of unknown function (DUF1552)